MFTMYSFIKKHKQLRDIAQHRTHFLRPTLAGEAIPLEARSTCTCEAALSVCTDSSLVAAVTSL